MRNCMELIITFSSEQDARGERNKEEKHDLMTSVSKRDGNPDSETVVDYSDDIVIKKLKRMLF